MPNGATTTKQYPNIHLANAADEPVDGENGFWQRRALDLGIMTMSRTNIPPYWNTTMVTAWVAVIIGVLTVLGAIGGLYVYTRDTNLENGIKIGEQRERERHREDRIKALENELLLKKRLAEEEKK